jgi:hypothetical protein
MPYNPEAEPTYLRLAQHATEPLQIEDFADDLEARGFVDWCLHKSYDADDIDRWWDRPHPKLDRMTPQESWPEVPERVLGIARWLVNEQASA